LTDALDKFVNDLQAEINEDTRRTYGDTMEIFLRFEDGKVKAASFLTDGCALGY